jgi:Sigma-54 interaction domain
MDFDADLFASSLNGDWRALVRLRANVLVTGPKAMLDAFIEACHEELRPPLAFASPRGPLPLHASKTLVITDVECLDESAQRRLLAWIQDPHNAETQILSLTSARLLVLVNADRFNRALYYHLNQIHLKLAVTVEGDRA